MSIATQERELNETCPQKIIFIWKSQKRHSVVNGNSKDKIIMFHKYRNFKVLGSEYLHNNKDLLFHVCVFIKYFSPHWLSQQSVCIGSNYGSNARILKHDRLKYSRASEILQRKRQFQLSGVSDAVTDFLIHNFLLHNFCLLLSSLVSLVHSCSQSGLAPKIRLFEINLM